MDVSLGVDLVSSYVWRGMYQTGPSIQPALGFSYAGLTLSLWGSSDFSISTDEHRSKEFDLALSYENSGFTVVLNDYWWSGEGHRYGRYSTDHYFEGMVGFHFGESFPLNIAVSTFFAGGDRDEKGDQNYSTYIELGYDFNIKGFSLTPSIGLSPWTGMYGTDFSVPAISLTARKDIKITESFSLPLFGQAVVSPEHDDVFFVVGVSF